MLFQQISLKNCASELVVFTIVEYLLTARKQIEYNPKMVPTLFPLTVTNIYTFGAEWGNKKSNQQKIWFYI